MNSINHGDESGCESIIASGESRGTQYQPIRVPVKKLFLRFYE